MCNDLETTLDIVVDYADYGKQCTRSWQWLKRKKLNNIKIYAKTIVRKYYDGEISRDVAEVAVHIIVNNLLVDLLGLEKVDLSDG